VPREVAVNITGEAMRGLLTLFIFVASGLSICAVRADAQVTLVLVKDIDHIEHLNLLERLWRDVDASRYKILLSEPNWPELKPIVPQHNTTPLTVPTQIMNDAKIVHFSDTGFEDQSAIAAPIGYTICHAAMKDLLVSCSGSLTAVYRTATDPDSREIDGLHYSITYVKPAAAAVQPSPGKCSISGELVVTFVELNRRSQFKCGDTGSLAFQYPSASKK
jgi:hypothetical protein